MLRRLLLGFDPAANRTRRSADCPNRRDDAPVRADACVIDEVVKLVADLLLGVLPLPAQPLPFGAVDRGCQLPFAPRC